MNFCNSCKLQHIDSAIISSSMRKLLASGDFLSVGVTFCDTHFRFLLRHIPATRPIPHKNCNHISTASPTDPMSTPPIKKMEKKTH
jgi:hypothetical protein